MKKMKKNVMLTLCAGALSLVCATGVVMVNANAEVTEDNGKVNVSSFTMVQTASAYIGDISANSVTGGIRFDATLSQADYKTLTENYNAVKFGMLVTPTDCIPTNAETDLVVGSTTLPEYDANATYTAESKFFYNKEITPVYNTTDYPELYTFRCAITKLQEYNFSRPYTAKAYIATQEEENGDWEYTYAGTAERAIYSIATYAMNDNLTFGEDETEQGLVENYLNGIIDKVQQYYDITVTQTVNGAVATEAKLGDTVTLKGVATKKSDTSRTLDMCPTVEVAENKALTAVKGTQNREYTVTGLGNVAYSWSSGADGAEYTASGESKINGQTKLDIDIANDMKLAVQKSFATLVPVDETHAGYSKYVGWNDEADVYKKTGSTVYAWAPNGEAGNSNSADYDSKYYNTYKGDPKYSGLTFTSDIQKYMTSGIYLYMDIVIPGKSSSPYINARPYIQWNSSSKYYFYQNYKVSGESQYYKDGTAMTGSGPGWVTTGNNVWLRLRITLKDWASSTYFGSVNGLEYFKDAVYLANISLSSELLTGDDLKVPFNKTYNETYKSTEYSATTHFIANTDTNPASTTSVTAVTDTADLEEIYDGRVGVVNWVTTGEAVASNRTYFSDTIVNAWKKYTYLTFDVCNMSNTGSTLIVNLRGTFNGTSTDGSGTQISSNTITTTGGSIIRVFEKQTDGSYAKAGNTSSSGLVKGTWYTIEVWVNNPTAMTTGSWGHYLSLGAIRNMYIDNIHISNYSWIDEVNASFNA